MPPEMIDYLSNLQIDIQNYLNASASVRDRFQEGLDRGYAALLPTLDYPLPGDLDHIDDGEIADAFAAWSDIQANHEANSRANLKALIALVRSWTR